MGVTWRQNIINLAISNNRKQAQKPRYIRSCANNPVIGMTEVKFLCNVPAVKESKKVGAGIAMYAENITITVPGFL